MAAKKKASKKAPTATVATGKSKSSGKTLIASDPNLNDEERAVVRAVKDFQNAELAIQLFEQENNALMEEYKALLEEREQKRQEANQLVRALDVSCGPWDRYTTRTSYDDTAFYNIVGKQKFLELGGSIGTTSVYSIDGSRIEWAIVNNLIPPAAVDEVKKVTPSYHAPDAS